MEAPLFEVCICFC